MGWMCESEGESKKHKKTFSVKHHGNRPKANWKEDTKLVIRRMSGKVVISVI
jgi:hypothetical protein